MNMPTRHKLIDITFSGIDKYNETRFEIRKFERMDEFLKIFSVFIACIFVFVKLGVPTAVVLFKYNFIKVMAVTWSGGITGSVIFTYLSASIIKGIHNWRVKRHKIHTKKVFKKSNRRIIRIKQKFGLAGIAFITPLISMPIGAFVAEKFYRDKKKVIIYLSVSVIFWSLTIYFILYLFHDSLKGWLI
jgi:hypothetical protein